MFHYVPSININTVLLGRYQAKHITFRDHIVLLMYSNGKSQQMALASFVLPLRSSDLHKSDMKQTVIVGDKAFINQHWPLLENTPKLVVYHGNPMSQTDLRAVNINQCYMCAVVSTCAARTTTIRLSSTRRRCSSRSWQRRCARQSTSSRC